MTPLPQAQLDWLLTQGVPMDAILWPEAIEWAGDNVYVIDGNHFWDADSGFVGGYFCLGEDNISDANAYSFDGALRLWETPLEWLKANRTGIVVIDWTQAFDRLRDCPRLAVPKGLMGKYKQWMKVPRMPDVRQC